MRVSLIMAVPGSLLGEKLLLGKIGQVLGELNLGGALTLFEEHSLGGVLHLVGLLEGVLILHVGGSLCQECLCTRGSSSSPLSSG